MRNYKIIRNPEDVPTRKRKVRKNKDNGDKDMTYEEFLEAQELFKKVESLKKFKDKIKECTDSGLVPHSLTFKFAQKDSSYGIKTFTIKKDGALPLVDVLEDEAQKLLEEFHNQLEKI